ncbi:hypothetical protein FGRMN_2973 [Fusarium graminum]|nr:hypothetical protein FGRMN_2973 [Fusarium graminum]
MKFFAVFSAVLASGSALAAYVPNGNIARGLSLDPAPIITRDSGLPASLREKTGVTYSKEELISALEPFLNELKQASTEATKASDDLEKRDVLTGLVGSVTELVGPDMPDFNQMIGHGFNVTASFITSTDLNAKAEGAITWASEKIASYDSIPASSLIKACLSGLKTLIAKVDINTYAASILSTVGGLVLHIDFNTAISKTISFVKSHMS